MSQYIWSKSDTKHRGNKWVKRAAYVRIMTYDKVLPLILFTAFLNILSADDWDPHFTQGEALELQGKYAAAVSEFEAALPAATAFGADDWRLPITLHNLGTVYRETGRYADAERCYRRAIAIFETHQPARKAELAGTLNNLGALDLVMGRNKKAGELYGRAYRLRVEALGAMHPLTAASLQGLAQVAQERRQYAEADRLYRQAARILEPALGAESLAMADLRHNWALLDRDAGRDRDALPLRSEPRQSTQKPHRSIQNERSSCGTWRTWR